MQPVLYVTDLQGFSYKGPQAVDASRLSTGTLEKRVFHAIADVGLPVCFLQKMRFSLSRPFIYLFIICLLLCCRHGGSVTRKDQQRVVDTRRYMKMYLTERYSRVPILVSRPCFARHFDSVIKIGSGENEREQTTTPTIVS